MHKGRLEAFSDGVIAIILTIMVLELKAPKEPTLAALSELWPVWLAYALSYYNVFSSAPRRRWLPRLGLVFFVAIPIARRVAVGFQRRGQNEA